MTQQVGGAGDCLIPKRAMNPDGFRRPTLSFANARTAFKAFLQVLDFSPDDEVLLPAYVGWSPKEGSGVFDPIQELGLKFGFYRVTRELAIDVDHVRALIRNRRPRVVVLIHYFGYPDPAAAEVIACAHEQGSLILEDEAHAFYSDWVGGVCGRYGDAAILSLHKMLPFSTGGILVLNETVGPDFSSHPAILELERPLEHNPFDYDLFSIASARRANAMKLIDLLHPLRGHVELLFPTLPEGVIPQTLPTLILDRSRDNLYFALNNAGYGVVSLYHTLIAPIGESQYPDSHMLARRILNLPVHQDIRAGQLEEMVTCLTRLLEE